MALIFLWASIYAPAIGDSHDKFTLNLNNTDIHALIKTVSTATGKNFVVDPRVNGRVTVVSATPVSASILYEMFLSVLQVHGFAAVPAGGLVKIVPDFSAKQGPVPLLGDATETRDQLVSQVIPILNVPADPLVQILRPMVPQEGQLAAYPASNSLVVTDRAANIQRLMDIIKLLDVPDSGDVDLVNLQHASAAEVVQTLSPFQRAGGSSGSPEFMQLVADERTNSILISGNQASRARVRALINDLDSPNEGGGNTRVVFLHFADAQDIAPILIGSPGGTVDIDGFDGPDFGGDFGFDDTEFDENGDDGNFQQPEAFSFSGSPSGGGSTVDIKVDENTNSLIITAPPSEMSKILSVIEQLDIRRPQVLVEAIIAEVTEDNIRELGVNFLLDGTDKSAPAGYSNLGGDTGRLLEGINATNGNLLPSLDSGVSFALGNFGGNDIDFGLLFRAIASDADNNILSTPTIVTLDNEEAEIVVGSNVPFVTGQQLGANNDNPFQTIEREDIGLRLNVKPQINAGDTIKLTLEQEVSNVNSTALAGAADITTSKRALTTTVLVEDGQTLVLGGLIDDQITDVVEKVPLLGDIPGIGRLFQSKSTSKSKRNLMIFLHPVILRDSDTTNRISSSKYNQLRAQRSQIQPGAQPFTIDDLENLPQIDLNLKPRVLPPEPSREPSRELTREPTLPPPLPPIDQSTINTPTRAPRTLNVKQLEWKELPDGSLQLEMP